MKQIISKALALIAFSTVLFSFAPKPGVAYGKPMATKGGEGFEIYLNDKLLVQRFGDGMKNATTLQLSSAAASDQLVIKYHHCGKVGKNRVITIRDDQNRILKEFRISDKSTPVLAISIPVKDILGLKKGNTVLKMYYSSEELPGGRMLASLNMSRQAV